MNLSKHIVPEKPKKVNPLERVWGVLKESNWALRFLLLIVLLRPSFDIFFQKDFQLHRSLPYLNLNAIVGGSILVLGILFLLQNIRRIISAPLLIPIAIFLGLMGLSILYSVNPTASIKEFIRLSSIFVLCLAAYLVIKKPKDLKLLILTILASFILPGLAGVFQLLTGRGMPDDMGGFNRIYGTFAHPNPFSFYAFLVLALVLSLYLVRKEKTGFWLNDNPYFIPAALLSVLLFFTFTRSGLVCLLIFLFIIGLLKYRWILLASAGFLIAAYFASEIFQERVWDMIILDPSSSVVWRFRLWKDAWPMVFWELWKGHGLNTFAIIIEFYRGNRWGSVEAHNDYLKILIENGIIGLVAYLFLIGSALVRLFKIYLKKAGAYRNLALGILLLFVSLYTVSAFDNILRITALQWNLWILTAAWLKINKNTARV